MKAKEVGLYLSMLKDLDPYHKETILMCVFAVAGIAVIRYHFYLK